MSWNTSLLSGPWPVPIYGAPVTDPVTGQTSTPITGYQSGVVFVIPADKVTPDLQPYAPIGSAATVTYGTNSTTSVSPTSPINLGATSGGAWVGNYIRKLVVT